MAETKFTEGPWRVLPPSVGVDLNWHVTDNGDTFVAHVYGFGHSVDEQSKINAHLIAAAPDLYEALTQAGDYISSLDFIGDENVVAAITAALAKARGEG